MSRWLSRFVIFCFLLVLPSIASAQNLAGNSAKTEPPEPANRKKSFDLIETISGQIGNLQSPANRINVECIVADLLWTGDEKRARALFKSASAELASLVATIDVGDQQAYQEVSSFNQQRQQVIDRVARHDPELALSILRETRLLPADADSGSNWISTNENNLELHLATLIARQDPARALKLAHKSLASGVSYGVIGFLNELQQKDPRSAQALYREMVDRIKTEDLAQNQQLANAAWNLLWFQPPQANEDTYRDLIATLTDVALMIRPNSQTNVNLAQSLYNEFRSQAQQIEKYAPDRAMAMRQWSDSVEATFDPSARMYREMEQVNQSGTVDDVLALAQKYPADLRSQIYQNAAWKAFSTDPNRARQIVSELISDPVQKRQMLEQFDSQALNNAANADQMAETRSLMNKLRNPDRKIQVLVQFANRLAAKNDKKGALNLLDEARTLVISMPGNSTQIWAQIQLAQAYAGLDLDQSFALVHPLVTKTNELIAAAAVLDGFENRYLKDGEWMTPGMSALANTVVSLNQCLVYLARLDFDRALALANLFERPEVRLMAELGIAEAALSRNGNDLPINASRISFRGGVGIIIDKE